MKREAPNLFAALLLGVFGNVLLTSQVGYSVRPGVLLFPISAAALTLAAVAFAWSWRILEKNPLARWSLMALLAMSSALEILRLWRLFSSAYPDGMSMFGICLMIVAPVIYLRRVSSIAQTANVVLSILLVTCVLLVISIAPQLRLFNLQSAPVTAQQVQTTFLAQAVLFPEYLLPALWPGSARFGKHTLLRLSLFGVTFSVAAHFVLELFFGAGAPLQENPLHTAAQSGALSIFNRLEWLQLILWTMIVTIKLAMYLYAGVHLMGGAACKSENNAVGLDRFPFYFGLMLLLCALWRSADIDRLASVRNLLLLIFTGMVILGGAFRWLLGARAKTA